ncbi:MAG TPA: MFS transporter [Streptosporangiaceae bacterium]|nr:MFS transporter [Streptosporangiaceae bacterium]
MTMTNAPSGTIRSALRYPSFRYLLSALAVSQVGDWLYNLALVVLVYDRTHSAAWAGVTTAARVLPIVVLGPVGGVLADRFDRRRIMIICDLARVALMLLLAAVAAAGLPIVLAPVIAAAATAAAAPYLPCVAAVTPRVVDDADLPGANAARSAVSGASIILGPALGGVLLFLGSPAAAFALNALTFGLSALAVLAIRDRGVFATRRSAQSQAAERPVSLFGGMLSELAEGAAALRQHPAALRLIGADIMCSTVYGTQTVLLLLVAGQVGLGMQGYGYLFAAIGAGGLAGTVLAGRASRSSRPQQAQLAALAAVGLPMLLLAVVRWPIAAVVLTGLTGLGAMLVEILTDTTLQRTLDEDVFGRAYGLALPASIAGIVVGSAAAPLLASLLGPSGALVATGSVVLAYGLLVLRGGYRHVEQHVPAAADAMAAVAAPAAAVVPPRPSDETVVLPRPWWEAAVAPRRSSDETVMLPIPWDPYIRMARPRDFTAVMPRPAVTDAPPAR